jgi:hypothetical protein
VGWRSSTVAASVYMPGTRKHSGIQPSLLRGGCVLEHIRQKCRLARSRTSSRAYAKGLRSDRAYPRTHQAHAQVIGPAVRPYRGGVLPGPSLTFGLSANRTAPGPARTPFLYLQLSVDLVAIDPCGDGIGPYRTYPDRGSSAGGQPPRLGPDPIRTFPSPFRSSRSHVSRATP